MIAAVVLGPPTKVAGMASYGVGQGVRRISRSAKRLLPRIHLTETQRKR
jgi:hypothetical protein